MNLYQKKLNRVNMLMEKQRRQNRIVGGLIVATLVLTAIIFSAVAITREEPEVQIQIPPSVVAPTATTLPTQTATATVVSTITPTNTPTPDPIRDLHLWYVCDGGADDKSDISMSEGEEHEVLLSVGCHLFITNKGNQNLVIEKNGQHYTTLSPGEMEVVTEGTFAYTFQQ